MRVIKGDTGCESGMEERVPTLRGVGFRVLEVHSPLYAILTHFCAECRYYFVYLDP